MERPDLMRAPQPAHHPRRSVSLELPVRQYDKVAAMAKERGLPTAVFALNLFNAAYSARQAPTGDTALDAAVAEIDAPDKTVTITKAARDALACERNDLLVEVSRATSEADALRTDVEQLRSELARAVQDRDEEIAALKEALSTRVRELLATRSDLVNSAEETSRWQAMSDSLGTQLKAALIARGEAERRAAIIPSLTPAQIRMARGLRAAGNSNREIARAFGVPIAVIGPLFKEADQRQHPVLWRQVR